MYPLDNNFLAEQHMQALQREAEIARTANSLRSDAQDKAGKWQFWYQVLNLPMPPPHEAQQADPGQAFTYNWRRGRTRSAVLTAGIAAFGIGTLVGGFLDNELGLAPVMLFAIIVALATLLPIVVRFLVLFNR